MKLVLDAGALIAIDRNDRGVAGLIELGRRVNAELVTVSPVLAQAWRDGATQARLAQALPMINVLTVDLELAKEAGQLLAAAHTNDVVDALVVLAAQPGDQILTSDPRDMAALLAVSNPRVTVVMV
jgi:PIN domain nuclease of toxin-antitoxin system